MEARILVVKVSLDADCETVQLNILPLLCLMSEAMI